ncbi:MAG: bifunctional folylpolyglutamate synthase/dihydrofolate synthase [Planctomycetota bacterium]|nr:bifunctional folylpolyglutamate synthase/dihydrofolate synthase [Planctomycetota bacterium]
MPAPASFEEAVEYLNGFVNYERIPAAAGPDDRRFGVARIEELAERLGRPDRRLRCIHVAGTKGKGSTCAFAAAILQAAGIRTGLYTSPHLVDMRERIRVGDGMIPKDAFTRAIQAMYPHLEEMRRRENSRRPTYFEIFTHAAFMHFAEAGVGAAVIEVGMGGRLDATNIISPTVCAIVNISLDHVEILGHTLAMIAGEKAGILKPGVPCVVSEQEPEAMAAIEEAAARTGSPLERVGREIRFEADAAGRLSVRTPRGQYEGIEPGLAGAHQRSNFAVALRCCEIFAERHGLALPAEAVVRGAREVRWPGRLQRISLDDTGRAMLLDGAHNVRSAEVLADALPAYAPREKRVLLFGCAKDKDARGMLRVLAPHFPRAVFASAGNPRSTPPRSLLDIWIGEHGGGDAGAVEDSDLACRTAALLIPPGGLLVVTGSLYLVGAVLAACGGGPDASAWFAGLRGGSRALRTG